MSGIRKAENTLFDQWETAFSGGGYFNRDGVVNPGQWESERDVRLLFLMKDTDRLREDLRDFLDRGGRGQTWNTVVRWAEALSGGSTAMPDGERRRAVLRRLCVVNLKKCSGGSRVSDDVLRQAAETDQIYLKQQLSIYRPTLALACGKGSVFRRYGHWRKNRRRFCGMMGADFASITPRCCAARWRNSGTPTGQTRRSGAGS